MIAAWAIAQQTGRTIGDVVSDLARRSLVPRAAAGERNGVPLLLIRNPGVIVTPDIVQALRD